MPKSLKKPLKGAVSIKYSQGKTRINSKKKGSRIELQLAHWLQKQGCSSARRAQQYAGYSGTADIHCDELSSFHIECKGTKSPILTRSNLKAWEEQLARDCPLNKMPVLFWKANGENWMCLRPVNFLMNQELADSLHGWVIPGTFICLDAEHCVRLMLAYENNTKTRSLEHRGRDEGGTSTQSSGLTNGAQRDSSSS